MKKKSTALALILAAAMTIGMLTGCGASYDYITGDVDWNSTYTSDKTINDTFYYSDDWFSGNPESQNDELALASMQLIASGITNEDNGYGASFLRSMGFNEIGFVNWDNKSADTCRYMWGRKTVSGSKGDYTLVAVVIQNYALDRKSRLKNWRQNFTANDPDASEPAGEHYAYSKAVDSIVDGVAELANTDSVKFWITGQSRGGAIANILSARLPEKLGDKNAGIFAYTFESPATVDAEAAGNFGYIHNYVCSDDLVTMIPMWGMTRYGVMHDLKTKKTDEGLEAELLSMGSDAADLKPRIVAETEATRLVEKLAARVPSRADYSALRTAEYVDEDWETHKVVFSYQEAGLALMDVIFKGGKDNPIRNLAGKKDGLNSMVSCLADGIILENEGKDPSEKYWEGTKILYGLLEEVCDDGKVPVDEEDLFKIVYLAAPVLVDLPEDGSGEPSMELLVDLVGYFEEMSYSHQFDTLIARLKVLAPAPDAK